MATDNLDEIAKRKLTGSAEDKRDEQRAKDIGLGDIKQSLKDQIEIRTMKSLLENPQQPAPVYMTPPTAPESPFKLTGSFDIGDIIKAETIARTAAESQKDQATRAWFETLADRYQDAIRTIQDNFNKAMAGQPQSANPLEQYKIVKSMMDEIKKDIQPTGLPAGNYDHSMLIELKKMEIDHSERLSQMQEESRRGLFQIQEESKDRERRWQLEDRKWQMELAKLNRQEKAFSRLAEMGDSIAASISESMGEGIPQTQAPAMSTMREPAPKLTSFKCQWESPEGIKCDGAVPVVGNKANCPKCGAEYEVT